MEWIKALHIIFVIAWMAGLFYLPRLFVYHAGTEIGSAQSETFKVMERKLLRIIMMPAMILTWAFGLDLAFHYGLADWSAGWTWIKALSVIVMTGTHFVFAAIARDFSADRNTRPARFFRMINEVPTVLMMVIVVMVVVKPF